MFRSLIKKRKPRGSFAAKLPQRKHWLEVPFFIFFRFMESAHHQFNQKTDYDTAQYLASRVVRTLLNQALNESTPLLPQLFQRNWERLVPNQTAPEAEKFIQVSVDQFFDLVCSSFLRKGNEFFQLPSPPNVQPPSPPSSQTSLSGLVESSTEHKQKIVGGHGFSKATHDWRTNGGYGVVGYFFLGALMISVPVGVVTGLGVGVFSGVGYGLLTAVGVPVGACSGLFVSLEYELPGFDYEEVVNISREKLEKATKTIVNEKMGKLEEGCVKKLVDFLKGESENASISGISLEGWEERFGNLLGINFDQLSLSLGDMRHENYYSQLHKTNQEDINLEKQNKIFTLSVSLDPDNSTASYFIISTLIIPPPNTLLPPSPYHFRFRFSTCREIYLKICSLHPNHALHFQSFPPRTYLPCYEKSFLIERGRGLLGWLRVCETDDRLHQCLSEEFMKFKGESREVSLQTIK